MLPLYGARDRGRFRLVITEGVSLGCQAESFTPGMIDIGLTPVTTLYVCVDYLYTRTGELKMGYKCH